MKRPLVLLLGVVSISIAGALSSALLNGASGQSAALSGVTHLDWGGAARSGPYPPPTGLRNVQVDEPNGRPASYRQLESLQYHHHTRVIISSTGRIWVAYSGDLHQEGESGMITEVKTSRDGTTWSPPIVVIAPPSPFDGGQASGRRISYPRAFVNYQHRLYLVAAIDQANGVGCCTNEQGEALVAVELKADGSVGAPFRVSRAAYNPRPGSPAYAYNSLLGPGIFALADNFGTWGGSAPGQPPSAWAGYAIAADGTVLVEPSTIAISSNSRGLLRLWRDEGATGKFVLYSSTSANFGSTWSAAAPTVLPNSPSAATALRLANGNIALAGNAIDQPAAADARDPLFLAIFDAKTGTVRHVYSVRRGLGHPKYDNQVQCGPDSKPCGAAYPGLYEHNGILYISYSVYKQEIWLASVPSKYL